MARRKRQTVQYPPCCPDHQEITYVTKEWTGGDTDQDGWVIGLHGVYGCFYVLVYFCPFCGTQLPEGSTYES